MPQQENFNKGFLCFYERSREAKPSLKLFRGSFYNDIFKRECFNRFTVIYKGWPNIYTLLYKTNFSACKYIHILHHCSNDIYQLSLQFKSYFRSRFYFELYVGYYVNIFIRGFNVQLNSTTTI